MLAAVPNVNAWRASPRGDDDDDDRPTDGRTPQIDWLPPLGALVGDARASDAHFGDESSAHIAASNWFYGPRTEANRP